jgi:hypothetical protein
MHILPEGWTIFGTLRWAIYGTGGFLAALFIEENVRSFFEAKGWNTLLTRLLAAVPNLANSRWFVNAVCLFGGAAAALLLIQLATPEVPSLPSRSTQAPILPAISALKGAAAPSLLKPAPGEVAPQLAGRSKDEIRQVQIRVNEICEFLNEKQRTLANLNEFPKFRMFLITNKEKANAVKVAEQDAKNVAALYSNVAGDFPSRFRTDWPELAPLTQGAYEAIAPLEEGLGGYRRALAQVKEPPTAQDADDLLNAVRPLQESVPVFQRWLNNAVENCIAKKGALAATPINAN